MKTSPPRISFLSNIKTTIYLDDEKKERSALLCFFYDEEGTWFRSLVKMYPYFYLRVAKDEWIPEVTNYLYKAFEQKIINIATIEKTDLDDINHMSG